MKVFAALLTPFTMFGNFVDTRPGITRVKEHLTTTKVDVVLSPKDDRRLIVYYVDDATKVRREIMEVPIPDGIDATGYMVGLAAGVSGSRHDTANLRRSTLNAFDKDVDKVLKQIKATQKKYEKAAETAPVVATATTTTTETKVDVIVPGTECPGQPA